LVQRLRGFGSRSSSKPWARSNSTANFNHCVARFLKTCALAVSAFSANFVHVKDHGNGDCGCEPAHQLTVAARGASFVIAECPSTEPRFGPSEAGFWTLNCL
jgi:hypothetical protein